MGKSPHHFAKARRILTPESKRGQAVTNGLLSSGKEVDTSGWKRKKGLKDRNKKNKLESSKSIRVKNLVHHAGVRKVKAALSHHTTLPRVCDAPNRIGSWLVA